MEPDSTEPDSIEPDSTEPDSIEPDWSPVVAGEPTVAVRVVPVGEVFVLQFSTGESARVSGSGLVGRNPQPEPGEWVDEIIPISDPGRSVSKTHLEFGQDDGRFWVLDRYSANGTSVRAADGVSRRLEPGRRCLVERGGRVDIGEQFFVVS